MSEDKKVRNMTPRGFLHKASGKIGASAFLAQHRAWLESGELASHTTPILRKMDEKDILPTPCLEAIKAIVLGHMLAVDSAKAEDAILNPKVGVVKPWMATVYNAKGEIQSRTKEDGSEEDLQKTFDTSSDADRWTDRRLFDGASDWYGVVAHTSIINRHGDPLSTVIMRDDSMGRILQVSKGPVMKGQSKSAGKLSFGVKVHNDRSVFSKG